MSNITNVNGTLSIVYSKTVNIFKKLFTKCVNYKDYKSAVDELLTRYNELSKEYSNYKVTVDRIKEEKDKNIQMLKEAVSEGTITIANLKTDIQKANVNYIKDISDKVEEILELKKQLANNKTKLDFNEAELKILKEKVDKFVDSLTSEETDKLITDVAEAYKDNKRMNATITNHILCGQGKKVVATKVLNSALSRKAKPLKEWYSKISEF